MVVIECLNLLVLAAEQEAAEAIEVLSGCDAMQSLLYLKVSPSLCGLLFNEIEKLYTQKQFQAVFSATTANHSARQLFQVKLFSFRFGTYDMNVNCIGRHGNSLRINIHL
jgi:hypothetical protein